ncbi:unnamed protein product [Pipistrellus nathusii]|uniref:Uncharacterized protein n=1 Tax=Pipistrellus nathusii TaxID=59473 RepID=A0ABN9ZRQ2_PIPNA
MPPAIQKPTLWGPGSDFYVDTGRLFTLSRDTAPLCNMKPANCFYVRFPVGSIAIVLFSLSCSLTLLMSLPQVAWQHKYLCKKKKKKRKKEKVNNDFLKNTPT